MTRPLVIAEAGVNHGGDLGRATGMVAAAAAAGADYVKFQAFSAGELVSKGARTAAYQADNTGEASQDALLRGLELSLDEFATLAGACRAAGIGFMATPFDPAMVEPLLALGMDRIKIASGELTNAPALARLAALHRPILLSTGMATLEEVGRALAVLEGHGAGDITLLHCTSLYPAPPDMLNLRAMTTLARTFGRPVGYSDHSLGDHAAIAATALGAAVIEKHFTLDRSLPGPDQRASLEPDELAALVRKVGDVATMLGDGEKRPVPAEAEIAARARRSWHAARDLPAGAVLGEGDLVLRRPADGLEAWTSPVGRRLARGIAADTPIRVTDLTEAA